MADTGFPTDVPLKSVVQGADNLLLADSEDGFNVKYTTVAAVLSSIDVSGKADKVNVLELDNTTSFTPDADHEPATKKYIDDNSSVDPTLRQDIDTNTDNITANTIQIGINTSNITTNTDNIILNTDHRDNIIDPHEGAVLIDVELKTFKETLGMPSSSSGVLTLDYSTANTFYVTLTEDVTSIVITNAPTGKAGNIILTLKQDAITPRTVDFSSINWHNSIMPVMTASTSGVDFYVLASYDSGTTWYGSIAGQAMA